MGAASVRQEQICPGGTSLGLLLAAACLWETRTSRTTGPCIRLLGAARQVGEQAVGSIPPLLAPSRALGTGAPHQEQAPQVQADTGLCGWSRGLLPVLGEGLWAGPGGCRGRREGAGLRPLRQSLTFPRRLCFSSPKAAGMQAGDPLHAPHPHSQGRVRPPDALARPPGPPGCPPPLATTTVSLLLDPLPPSCSLIPALPGKGLLLTVAEGTTPRAAKTSQGRQTQGTCGIPQVKSHGRLPWTPSPALPLLALAAPPFCTIKLPVCPRVLALRCSPTGRKTRSRASLGGKGHIVLSCAGLPQCYTLGPEGCGGLSKGTCGGRVLSSS